MERPRRRRLPVRTGQDADEARRRQPLSPAGRGGTIQPRQGDDGKFEPLGGVDGHDADDVLPFAQDGSLFERSRSPVPPGHVVGAAPKRPSPGGFILPGEIDGPPEVGQGPPSQVGREDHEGDGTGRELLQKPRRPQKEGPTAQPQELLCRGAFPLGEDRPQRHLPLQSLVGQGRRPFQGEAGEGRGEPARQGHVVVAVGEASQEGHGVAHLAAGEEGFPAQKDGWEPPLSAEHLFEEAVGRPRRHEDGHVPPRRRPCGAQSAVPERLPPHSLQGQGQGPGQTPSGHLIPAVVVPFLPATGLFVCLHEERQGPRLRRPVPGLPPGQVVGAVQILIGEGAAGRQPSAPEVTEEVVDDVEVGRPAPETLREAVAGGGRCPVLAGPHDVAGEEVRFGVTEAVDRLLQVTDDEKRALPPSSGGLDGGGDKLFLDHVGVLILVDDDGPIGGAPLGVTPQGVAAEADHVVEVEEAPAPLFFLPEGPEKGGQLQQEGPAVPVGGGAFSVRGEEQGFQGALVLKGLAKRDETAEAPLRPLFDDGLGRPVDLGGAAAGGLLQKGGEGPDGLGQPFLAGLRPGGLHGGEEGFGLVFRPLVGGDGVEGPAPPGAGFAPEGEATSAVLLAGPLVKGLQLFVVAGEVFGPPGPAPEEGRGRSGQGDELLRAVSGQNGLHCGLVEDGGEVLPFGAQP